MSNSIRFLGFAVLAWAGVRALGVALGPNSDALTFDTPAAIEAAESGLPPLPETRFDPVEPVAPATMAMPPAAEGAFPYPAYAGYPASYRPAAYGYAPPTAYPYPVYIPVQQAAYRQSSPAPRQRAYAQIDPMPQTAWLDGAPDPDPYPYTRMAASGPVRPAVQVTPTFTDPPNNPRGYDRWQLSSWAMLRSKPGQPSLAANGMLGGSQAGARLIYRFDPRLGISIRTTAPLQSAERGIEIAAGIRAQPLRSIPIAFTIERRQWVGKGAGQSDFALFAEGGVWGKRLPFGMTLDGYLQTGVVGVKRRAWFVDGSLAATRPVWRNLSAGVGVWGGAQQGLTRLDAGPRLTMKMGRGMYIHADYRAKLVGNAQPGSGAVVTLAGDF